MPAAFSLELFKFLRALQRNNSREWFAANKPRYESAVCQPCLQFIRELEAPLKTISPHFVASAKPVGGSLFRIHRDTRFSNDKTPYKTHVGMTFFHEATRQQARGGDGNGGAMGRLDAPVFYLHLEPGACFVGGGVWHPQSESTQRIRHYLANNPQSWIKVTRSPAFTNVFSLEGDALQRPPAGFDKAHPLIDDLKRKDFICSASLTDAQVCSPALLKLVTQRFALAAPMLDWLCGALDLDF